MAAWREQPGAPDDGAARRRSTNGEPGGPELVPQSQSLRWGRGLLVTVSLIATLVLLAVAAVLVLTGTDWGRERIRRVAENRLNGMIHGKATIGRLSGNLLVGMTVHDLSITDSAGAPFLAVESISADYSIIRLFRKRIWLNNAVIVRPVVVLDHPPNGHWNWSRIFPRDTTHRPASTRTQWGDWIRVTGASVVNGQLIVRTPWSAGKRLAPAARDSLVRDALRGGTRLMIERAPGGFQKRVQLDSVTATIPLLRLTEPGYSESLLQVSALTMHAFPFRPPGAVVRDVKGIFPFTTDSVWWTGAYAELPKSSVDGDGSFAFGSGDLTLVLHAHPASSADMRWIYPRLPSNGRGTFDLALAWRGDVQRYQFSNADVTMGAARAAGTFGVTLDDTIAIHNTRLRFSGVGTRTLEELVPHFTAPRRGVFAGRATVAGGRHALNVDGDVTFDDERAGVSRVIGVGQLGFPERGGVAARDLRLQLLPAQVDMVRTWYPSLPIGGVVTGSATVNGSTTSQLAMTLDIEHRDRGALSAFTGSTTVHLAGGMRVEADVMAHPVSLVTVGRFVPSADLQGSATGRVRVGGSLANLRVQTDLRLLDGARFAARGTLDVASEQKGYNLTVSLYALNLHTVIRKAPITSLTGQITGVGRGMQLATLTSTIDASLSASRWDSIAVDSLSVRGHVADGLATVQRMFVAASHARASATGTFGLVRGQIGQLAYSVDVDSLGAFNRWLPKTAGATTTPVAPRPMLVARAMQRARADSARAAHATEMKRLLSGEPGPRLHVEAPAPVARDTISGSAHLAGIVRGNVYDFDLRGRAEGEQVVARGNFVHHFASEYAWVDARTSHAKLAIGIEADSVTAMGFGFDTVSARLTYASPGGRIELVVGQGDGRQYSAKGDYALYPGRGEIRLTQLTFRFDTAFWSMPHPSSVQWGGSGVRVTDLELRNRGAGRIYANGLLPTNGVADFQIAADSFPVSNLADVLQTDLQVSGIVSLKGTMKGTLRDPAFQGTFESAQGKYSGTLVPDLSGRFGYADRQLVAHFDALHGGTTLATVDAHLPIDLAFTGVTGDRLLPLPMSIDVGGDSLPIELIPQFTDLVSDVRGHAGGHVEIRGTIKSPSLAGSLELDHAAVTLSATGATIDNLAGAVHLAKDTVYVDSLAGTAKGRVKLLGSLAMTNWREPSFDLHLVSKGADLLRNDFADIRLDAGLALTGPFRHAYLSGAVTVDQGVIYAPEPNGRHLIGAGDPALYNVLDTTSEVDRNLFPPQSPLVANLRTDVAVAIKHNTWVRNREANIEIYTDDAVLVHAEDQALLITGSVVTDRGEYSFLSKRFQISRGSAIFVGTPDINPTLQITGEYQVDVASRGALNIRVLIGGTMKRPNLSLESDAQPPKTQSELLSLLAFGQSTATLVSSGGSSIAGSAATLDLFGVGAQVAVRRLASVALGVLVDQVEIPAGRAFGTDVFDITPADVPTEIGSGRGVGNFLTQTRFEVGKYVNPRTFVSVQVQSRNLGTTIEHRTADGWRFNATIEPRLLLLEPTLNSQPFRTVQSYGGFILREWRF